MSRRKTPEYQYEIVRSNFKVSENVQTFNEYLTRLGKDGWRVHSFWRDDLDVAFALLEKRLE